MALTKCINSESKQYKPVLVDKLILDDVPTVNSLNAITSDAVARAVAGASGEVPAVTENDNGKVLKAVYDAGGPAVEWGEAAPAVTVDQTYNALSENAQSGVAVAEAIAGIPSSSYSAGDGIKIDNGEVSVDYDANTIDAVASQVTENVSTVSTGHHINFNIEDSQFEVPLEIQSWYNIYPSPTSTITMTIPANTFYYSGTISAGQNVVVTVFNTSFQLTNMANLTSQPLTTTYDSTENKTWIDGQAVTFHYPLNTPEWSSPYYGKLKTMALGVFDYSTYTANPFHTDSTTLANPIVFTYTSASHKKITVKNPLPASTSAEANKVLTVDAQGEPQWQTAQGGGSSYTAGNGISIDGNNEIAVKTAGNGFTFDGTEYQNQYASDYKFSFTPGVRPVDRSQFVVNNTIYVSGHNNESVHLVIAKQYNETDYAVCNHSVQLSEDHLSSRTVFDLYGLDGRGYMSTSNTDWTFSSPEVQLNYGNVFVYITIAGSSGSPDTPNGEIPLKVCKTETYDSTTYYSCSIVLRSAVGCLQIDQSLVLPEHSYLDNNKMLAVDGYGNAVWRAVIPAFTSAEAGKVLQVQNDGTLAWVTLS